MINAKTGGSPSAAVSAPRIFVEGKFDKKILSALFKIGGVNDKVRVRNYLKRSLTTQDFSTVLKIFPKKPVLTSMSQRNSLKTLVFRNPKILSNFVS